MEETLTKVCSILEVKENALNSFVIEGERVLVSKIENTFYITNGTCSHRGANLAKGTLINSKTVQCPWHKSEFNLKDGSLLHGPHLTNVPLIDSTTKYFFPCLTTYEPIVKDGYLYIKGNVKKQTVRIK